MRGLQGKRIVIAGGGAGIGAATAERLTQEGAKVVVGDVNFDGAQATAKRLTEADGSAIAVEFDLTDDSSVQALAETAVTEFGGVDGLFNVAADLSVQNLGRDANLLGMDLAVWRRTFEVNLSKAAINALTRHIASAWGKQGIRCNTLAPGVVMTEIALEQVSEEMRAGILQTIRTPRMGKPADPAATAAFLLSDDAQWVNGQAWSVDGGLTIRD